MSFRFFGRVIFISLPIIVVIAALLICIAGWGGYHLLKNPDIDILDIAKETDRKADVTETPMKSQDLNGVQEEVRQKQTKNPQDIIHVYIVGCVNKPGMYEMSKGQMIYDAVELAGGLTKEADKENINMAYILNENAMIKILPVNKSASKDNENSDKTTGSGSGAEIISGIDKAGTSNQANSGNTAKVNINTATMEELKTLPGIGDAKAQDIINYRESNGPFKRIEDIMNVPGIKEARYKSLKDKICV